VLHGLMLLREFNDRTRQGGALKCHEILLE
jgi:hypothetical protein